MDVSICMIASETGLEEFWLQRVGWVAWDIGVDIRTILKILGTLVVLILALNMFGILG